MQTAIADGKGDEFKAWWEWTVKTYGDQAGDCNSYWIWRGDFLGVFDSMWDFVRNVCDYDECAFQSLDFAQTKAFIDYDQLAEYLLREYHNGFAIPYENKFMIFDVG